MVDITFIPANESRLYLCACWQRARRGPVIVHSDRGSQFASTDYRQFFKDHHITSNMSAVGRWQQLQQLNSSVYSTVDELIATTTCPQPRLGPVFDSIERFHAPRMQRRLKASIRSLTPNQPLVERGRGADAVSVVDRSGFNGVPLAEILLALSVCISAPGSHPTIADMLHCRSQVSVAGRFA
jgi:hypothetical protein